jgi:predicted AAA+ superfamily ATPase
MIFLYICNSIADLQDNPQRYFMITRFYKMQDVDNDSVFLFGARQTGKTTILKQLFPEVRYYDLAMTVLFGQLHEKYFIATSVSVVYIRHYLP